MLHRRARSPETWNPRGPLPGNCQYTINRSHWAAPALLGVWLLGRGVPVNLVTGEIATPVNDFFTPFHPPGGRVGPLGPAFYQDSGFKYWRVRQTGPLVAGRSEWTIAAVVAQLDGSNSGSSGWSIYSERTAGTPILKLETRLNQYGTTFRNDVPQLTQILAGAGSANGLMRMPSVTMRPGGGGRVIRVYDGLSAFAQTDWGTNSVAVTSGGAFIAGGEAGDGGFLGDIALVVVSAAGWSDAQMQAWSQEPYRVLTPAG
jgi:hypothetical protein